MSDRLAATNADRRRPIGPWRIVRKERDRFQWSRRYLMPYGTVLTKFTVVYKAEND